MKYKKSLVEEYWSKTDCSASDKNFYCFPPIRSRSCRLIFNEHDAGQKDWCEYWTVEKYLKHRIPFKKCLSICCGFGEMERILSKLQVAKKIIGTDIAPGAVDKARERAAQEQLNNIEYYVADLNAEKIPENEYDLIWANGALHHIRDLDTVIPKLKNALCPGGYLVSNEYVGPNYQQLGQRQQELVDAAKHLLPPELRKNKFWQMPSVEYFLNTDPSEGVNSENILPVLKQHFEQVEILPYHGSILLYALDDNFYNNFDFQNDSHRKVLETLFIIEDAFISAGEIQNDNAHIICSKR